MDRRRFLWQGVGLGGLTLGTGGFLFVRRSQARSAMTSRMLDDALPPLAAKDLKELESLPVRAREEIRRFFHGKCLNVGGFVSHICSAPFGETLSHCGTQKEREDCLTAEFCRRVTAADEILDQVRTIADTVGSDLDRAWGAYTTDLSLKWNARIAGYGSPLVSDSLVDRVDGFIRNEMANIRKDATTATQKPALGETIGAIGASAVLLLPLIEFGQVGLAVGVPVFLLLAAKPIWEFVLAQLDDRRSDTQAAISGKLALLGNQVAGEFEREVRLRLADLHHWQQRSIRETATRVVEERIGLI
jgi:hypothetical protein